MVLHHADTSAWTCDSQVRLLALFSALTQPSMYLMLLQNTETDLKVVLICRLINCPYVMQDAVQIAPYALKVTQQQSLTFALTAC